MKDPRPRVLVLTPDLPFPVQSGGRARAASILEALASFASVHVACLAADRPDEARAWMERLGGSLTARPPAACSRGRLWRQRLRMALAADNLRPHPDDAPFFTDEFERVRPDIVWLETPYLLPHALAWQGRTRLIVDYWGTSEGARRDWLSARGLRRAWEWLRWRAARGGERRTVPRLTDLVTVSAPDARHFAALNPRARLWSIPIGIPRERLAPRPHPAAEEPGLMIMTGDLSYRPNVDAARYFTEAILPRIRAQHPAARARFTGRAPSAEALALRREPGVEVTGFAPDLAAVVETAALYVLPMRLGSGIRSKLLDVFPLGKAIVSTTIGAEGLDLTHGENCLLADEAGAFAEACLRLLADEPLRRALGRGARRLAETVYAQDTIARQVRDAVQTPPGQA